MIPLRNEDFGLGAMNTVCSDSLQDKSSVAYNFLFFNSMGEHPRLYWRPLITDLVARSLMKAISPGNSKAKSNLGENHRLSTAQGLIKAPVYW